MSGATQTPGGTRPGVVPWDGRGAVRARLEDEAGTAVALLERFGDLLAVALDAAGRGDDAALDAAVAERAWVMAELEPLLASLAAARSGVRSARPARAQAPGASVPGRRRGSAFPASVSAAELAVILAPVDEALGHAQLLHDRLSDEMGRRGTLTLVR